MSKKDIKLENINKEYCEMDVILYSQHKLNLMENFQSNIMCSLKINPINYKINFEKGL